MKKTAQTSMIILGALLLIISGCNSGSYSSTADGVIVTLESASDSEARLVRIEVINEEIFRVSDHLHW